MIDELDVLVGVVRLYPIDALTDIDKNTIASYISIYGNAECAPMNITLKEWNKNKIKLFKAFGHNLLFLKRISIPKDTSPRQDLYTLSRLFLHKNLVKGYICSLETTEPYHFRDFKCTIKNGMKTIRTIQKVLKQLNILIWICLSNGEIKLVLFKQRDEIQAKLVLSIHPIDFMTMSENNCNWRSCMSWSNKWMLSCGDS